MGDADDPGHDRGRGSSPPVRWFRDALFAAVMLLCFGVLGLLWFLVGRRRRQRRTAGCRTCRRRRRVTMVAVSGFAVLLVVGAGVRAQVAAVDGCHERFEAGVEQAVTEPHADLPPGGWWELTRQTATAPISGVTLMVTRSAGMSHCSGSSVLVAFQPPPSIDEGGSVIGNVFVTWIPESGGPRVALPGQESYVRFGPNAETDPKWMEGIARHESRHVDQWAVATLLGGPVAMPVAYTLDGLLFPRARNHFERHAGLADGGYQAPADYAPRPLWLPLAVTVVLVLLVLYRRLRWATRVMSGGRSAGGAHQVDRCPLHTAGWFRIADPRRPAPEVR